MTEYVVRSPDVRIARLIEYGAELEPLEIRLTLVESKKRPNRKPCPGFMIVLKEPEGSLYAECMTCKKDQIVISIARLHRRQGPTFEPRLNQPRRAGPPLRLTALSRSPISA
jgi:hypothetical protein